MKTIKLRVKKRECKEICPIPLELIPNIEKGIKNIEFNEKTNLAKIIYDNELIDKKHIIKKLKEIGYEVSE